MSESPPQLTGKRAVGIFSIRSVITVATPVDCTTGTVGFSVKRSA